MKSDTISTVNPFSTNNLPHIQINQLICHAWIRTTAMSYQSGTSPLLIKRGMSSPKISKGGRFSIKIRRLAKTGGYRKKREMPDFFTVVTTKLIQLNFIY